MQSYRKAQLQRHVNRKLTHMITNSKYRLIMCNSDCRPCKFSFAADTSLPRDVMARSIINGLHARMQTVVQACKDANSRVIEAHTLPAPSYTVLLHVLWLCSGQRRTC